MSKYMDLAHAMQSGVAAKMAIDPSDTSPKHLRTGINSAMVNDAALARLLIARGLFTEEEYVEAITEEMGREVERYKQWFANRGVNVDFA